jgi:hypothetical protein
MNHNQRSRQPARVAWSHERLVHERSVAMGNSISLATSSSYSSALQSYLNFCRLHKLPVDPTPDTLSFYIVFMCHHIQPRSVLSYLSGICNQLDAFFPEVRRNRRHYLVTKTLAGCQRLRNIPTARKAPLTITHLIHALASHALNPTHDDILFVCQLLTGFHALLRLGELVWPDTTRLQDYRKITQRRSVLTTPATFEFVLPGCKTDKTFAGNHILVRKISADHDPHRVFITYLASRDKLFPYNPELWLRSNGTIPTYKWFIQRMRGLFPRDMAGHSIRSGGATALAEANVAPSLIMVIGRWTSEAWRGYIRKHPVLLGGLIYS